MFALITIAALLGSSVPTQAAAGAQKPLDIHDDFSHYASGAQLGAPWFSTSFGWAVEDGKLHTQGIPGMLALREPQWYRRARIEVTVTPLKGLTSGWQVLGIGLYHDADHFWHAALVQAPDGSHHFELGEMQPGQWPSQEGYTVVSQTGPNFDWQYGHPYRLVLDLQPGRISTRLTELDGTVRAEKTCGLTAGGVSDGSPVLKTSGIEADFDDLVVQASDSAGSPSEEVAKHPPVDVATIPEVHGKATGFFHLERHGDVWWIIAPNGQGFYAIGTDHCSYAGHFCQALGYSPYGRTNQALYGSPAKWAKTETARLKDWNFDLLGAGCDPAARYMGLAHVEFVAFGSDYAAYDPLVKKTTWTGFPNVFSPDWPKWCDTKAWQITRANRNDPWLFGYFLDNELEWFGKTGQDVGLAVEAAKLPADNPAHKALVDLLRKRHGTIAALDKAWGADYKSWDDLAAASELHARNEAALHADQMAYVAEAADLYFRYTSEALKRYDPNHMNLGCRFAMYAPDPAWRAAGKYCDIVSFNYYGRIDLDTGVPTDVPAQWIKYHDLALRPMMITEWSFPALDSGLPCLHGAGMRVATQAQKARCYEIYQRAMFSLPWMVGSDYFMWVDEPAQGISKTFPEDSNYGLVTYKDQPYETLVDTARRVNAMAYLLHSGKRPDIAVREVALRGGRVEAHVANEGGSEASFDLVFMVNGKAAQTARARLAAGADRWLALDETPPKPFFVRVIADPERKLADSNWGNNQADLVEATGGAWPAAPAGRWVARMPAWASAGGLGFDGPVVVTLSGDALKAFGPASQVARRVAAYDATGRPLPCQLEPWLDGWQIAVRLPELQANSGDAFAVYVAEEDLPAATPAVSMTISDTTYTAGNGTLLLQGTAQGNTVDDIKWDGHEMGRLSPLVWERRAGQSLWTQPDATLGVRGFSGPVRAALEVVSEARPQADVITAVDAEGKPAPRQVGPHRFEVAHRIWLEPGRSWFTDRFLWLRNADTSAMTVGGWYSYLLSDLGGSQAGDVSGGPDVPNYYLSFGCWEDKAAGLGLGASPVPDPRVSCSFWQDPGGGEHPDLWRKIDPMKTLAPGAEYREETPAPVAAIFAGPAGKDPWAAAVHYTRALGQMKTGELKIERR